ncbi:MAG: DUF2029 domain-containing protein [Planctomycetes bacterium]|nr:DUF2029 domain-containing protein [Planctomycetota bacterium]
MLRWIAVLTVAWRLLLAWASPVPSWDGVSYLWMAQRFAALDFASALEEVFPPGFSLLLAPWLALGLDPLTAGAWFGALCAGATVWPLAAICRREAPGAEVAVAVLWATSSLLARTAAEILSEPPYLLAMALGTLAGLRERWWQVGVWSAIAFWIRPEGSLLAAAFVLQHRWRAARALLPVAVGVLLLAWLRQACGHGFDPLPIHGFHEQRDDLPARGAILANLVDLPGGWLEAYGAVGVLALVGWWRVGRRRGSAFGWMVGLQIGVVLTFIVRRRFLLSCAVPVFVWAAQAVQALRPRWRIAVLTLCAVLGVGGAWHGLTEADRAAERDLGLWLGARLEPHQTLTGDLTRVVWFAGRRPLPPRRFEADRILAMAAPPEVRFVVIGTRRQTAAELDQGLRAHFAELALPPELAAAAAARGIRVYERR